MKYSSIILLLFVICSCTTLPDKETKNIPIRSVFQSSHNKRITDIAISPDKKLIATSSIDGRVIIYRAKDGVIVHQLGMGHSQAFFSVAFSPSGRYLAAGAWGIIIYDTITGEELKRVDNGGHAAGVAFSSDERYVYYGTSARWLTDAPDDLRKSDNFGTISKIQWKAMKPSIQTEFEDEGIISPIYTIKDLDGPAIKFKANHDSSLFGIMLANNEFQLYNNSLNKQKLKNFHIKVDDFIFLDDGTLLLVTPLGTLYKYENDKLHDIGFLDSKNTNFAKNCDSKSLYYFNNGKSLAKYNLLEESKIETIAYLPSNGLNFVVTEDEYKFWSVGGEWGHRTISILTEKGLDVTPTYQDIYRPEDIYLVNNLIGFKNNGLNAINKENLTVKKIDNFPSTKRSNHSIKNIHKYYQKKYGKKYAEWGVEGVSEWYAFHPDGQRVYLQDENHNIIIFDNINERILRSRNILNGYWSIGSLSESGDLLAIANTKDMIAVLDTNDLKTIATFQFPRYRVSKMLIFDEKTIVLVSDAGIISFIDIETGHRVSFIASEDDWIFYTDDGYFAGTKDSGKLLAIVQGTEAYGIDQFAVRFNRPDIILERLGVENNELNQYVNTFYEKRLRKLGIPQDNIENNLHVPESEILNLSVNGREAVLEASFSDSLYELKSYSIYVNDVPIYGANGKEITGMNYVCKENITLNPGVNKIEISAFNINGAESYRKLTSTVVNVEVKPSLYFLGFGVSDYQNDDLNLKYAHQDVKDLNDMIKKNEFYLNVNSLIFTDDEVSPENILKAKEFLSNTKTEDTVILFIAGHGMYDMVGHPTYYYLTHNTDLNNLKGTAISFEEIESLLQGIPARQKLFLLDTCESGELDLDTRLTKLQEADKNGLSSRSIRGLSILKSNGIETDNIEELSEEDINDQLSKRDDRSFIYDRDRFIRNDLARRSGTIVFSSSGAGEYSYESAKYQNGLFTESLLEVLTDTETLNVRDLISEVISNVQILSNGLQNPTVDRDNIFIDFDLK